LAIHSVKMHASYGRTSAFENSKQQLQKLWSQSVFSNKVAFGQFMMRA